jgi:hypothetical protein
MRVLAFDIGIKNLAFCVLEKAARDSIIAWENVNIFMDEADSAAEAVSSCCRCHSKAKFSVFRDSLFAVDLGSLAVTAKDAAQQTADSNSSSKTLNYCQRHLPPDRPPLKDISNGEIYTAIPSLTALKEIAAKSGAGKPAKLSKDGYIELLKKQYALPLKQPKKQRVMHAGLEAIHDALLKVIEDRWAILKTCNVILLENQPVFKNPTMKSVQVLLFATLRSAFINNKLPVPRVHLVHAGKKVAAEKGDAGYAARKEGSETRAAAWIQGQWKEQFNAAKKKSDLADALCMCLDYKAS